MGKTKTGRPRSETARTAILDAALALLNEEGAAALTVEGVARRAGVGKPTIYRWWPSLADVVLEGLLRRAETAVPVPPFTTLGQTLRRFMRLSMDALADDASVPLRYLMAHAQQDRVFRARFRENFVAERRTALRSIFLQASTTGELPAGQDPDLLVDILFGALWYRLLTDHAPLDRTFADALTDLVLTAVHNASN